MNTTTLSITEQTVDLWGGRLSITVKVAGAGAPLLYLHPAAGLTWDPFLTHLTTHYTVYAPEFPGTSEGNPYAIHTIDTLSDMVLAYEELIRTLGLDHPVIVGQSFGGMLAAELASTFHALPNRLILLDPIGLWHEGAPTANWVATPPDQLPALLFHDPEGPAAQAMLAPTDDVEQLQAAAAAMVWAMGCTGKFAWPIPDRGLRHRLHRLAVPTLIIWGRDDKLISVEYAEHFHKLISDSTVTIINECGHIPQVEKFDETVEAVDKFLI
ncbi:alpha/beta hydrolase [Gordonia sp. TBRC 11910]|uniref:Alpha/beta hydrolase n=1 Tax=Gordonia asplenii TaxID=2725283 RepID=A0A848L6K8_9ACTN|nr:alpha/beta hydrolase [Gordonia asplenii]NMO04635.1 alpha/beta hydrolase [Gordonia asplenii]